MKLHLFRIDYEETTGKRWFIARILNKKIVKLGSKKKESRFDLINRFIKKNNIKKSEIEKIIRYQGISRSSEVAMVLSDLLDKASE